VTPESGHTATNGTSLHHLRWGDGEPTVLMLHGNSHCGGVWAPLAERLAAAGDTVIAVDLRGHGGSDKPDSRYDWGTLRDDLLGFLETMDLRDIVLVAHSRGGAVSLLVGAAVPERVRGVMAFEPSAPAWQPMTDVPAGFAGRTSVLAERALKRRAVFASREQLLDHWRGRPAFREWQEAYLRAYVEYGTTDCEDGSVELSCPPWVEARLYEALLDPSAWAGVYAPELPVLIVYGERSGRLSPGRDPAAALRPLFPRLETEVMAGATHFGPMEQPDRFEQAFHAFVSRLGHRGSRH
jgi:pimeloyl-ACP methyl ester carboxylesterase